MTGSAVGSSSFPRSGVNDVGQLADRLRSGRRASGLTQQQVAEMLGVARTTIVAIEKGERLVQPDELLKFSRAYGVQVNTLLRPISVPADFVAQFRLGPSSTRDARALAESVEHLQRLADDYLELERLANSPLPRNYPPETSIDNLDPTEAGEIVATKERNRLGLGDAPVHQLRQLLESDVGLRIFAMALPSKVAGLFVTSDVYGACVGFNSAHPGERQRWSLAHEYGHFLTQRSRPEVTALNGYQRVPQIERFADAFAENFLMPATGVKRRYHEIRQHREKGVSPADLLHLADLFQVSLEALMRRLENLDLLRSHTWERLVKQGFMVQEAREMLELAALEPDRELLPLRYRYLAVEAYGSGDISEAQFARLLRIDRVAARQLSRELMRRTQFNESGASSLVELDSSGEVDLELG